MAYGKALGRAGAVIAAYALVLGGCTSTTQGDAAPTDDEPTTDASAPADDAEKPPLHGVRIVVDPGHQLGNANFPHEINRLVPAGEFRKPCNTTGTASESGYPEATVTWQVSQQLASRLRRLGASVRMTRQSNDAEQWGPCVNVRGRMGNDWPADLKLSIHADGADPNSRGFHIIAAADGSRRLATAIRTGLRRRHFPIAAYIGDRGVDIRDDLATLNLSTVPTVLVELGNMRNRDDARGMERRAGRTRYARGLLSGVRTYLDR